MTENVCFCCQVVYQDTVARDVLGDTPQLRMYPCLLSGGVSVARGVLGNTPSLKVYLCLLSGGVSRHSVAVHEMCWGIHHD